MRAAPETLELGSRTVETWTYGGLPGRELRVKQGERVRIRLENALPEETTIHWHGLRIPNAMDGVPHVTQEPVMPGESFLYDFVPPDAGTFFFHPHHGTQLDRGLYAPLVVEARDEALDYDREVTLLLDDWLDGIDGRTPDDALDDLLANGMPGMHHGMMGMGGMGHDMTGMPTPGPYLAADGSEARWGSLPGLANVLGTGMLDAGDVRHPLYLVNGRPPEDPLAVSVRSGERLRLRVINAASDTIFSLAVDGHPLTVVAADGHRVAPVETDALVLGMGERFDVLLEADDPGAYRIVADALGKDGRAVATLRYAESPQSSMPPATAPIATGARTVSYEDLRALEPVPLPGSSRDLVLELGMDESQPYAWTINGQAFPEAEPIALGLDEPVRLVFANSTMMAHPMHLHGMVFRPSGAGPEAPLKDTITISSMAQAAVELVADAPGGWMLHCHNTYHALAGMMRLVDVGG